MGIQGQSSWVSYVFGSERKDDITRITRKKTNLRIKSHRNYLTITNTQLKPGKPTYIKDKSLNTCNSHTIIQQSDVTALTSRWKAARELQKRCYLLVTYRPQSSPYTPSPASPPRSHGSLWKIWCSEAVWNPFQERNKSCTGEEWEILGDIWMSSEELVCCDVYYESDLCLCLQIVNVCVNLSRGVNDFKLCINDR